MSAKLTTEQRQILTYMARTKDPYVCAIANRRGLGFVNPYPIKRG